MVLKKKKGWNWTGGQFAWLPLLEEGDFPSQRQAEIYNEPEQKESSR